MQSKLVDGGYRTRFSDWDPMSHGIQAGLEIRVSSFIDSAVWRAIAPSIDVDEIANRTLFALLVGRVSWLNLEPGTNLRGLPGDVTIAVKAQYEAWNGGAYDASWVSYEELLAIAGQLSKALEDLAAGDRSELIQLLDQHCGVSIDAILAFMAVHHGRGIQTRMVFWFTPI